MTEICFVAGFTTGFGFGVFTGIGVMSGVVWIIVRLVKYCYSESIDAFDE